MSDAKATLLPWDDVVLFDKSKLYTVSDEVYQYALDEGNHDQLFESAFESLKKSDPENATFEKAERLVELMKMFAKMALELKK